MKAASGLGFYLYPPVDFAVRWDGRRSEIAWLDPQGRVPEWLPMDGGADVYLPDSDAVRAAVPDGRRDVLDSVLHPEGMMFANADPRAPYQMEITTGLIARTPPGWGSLIGGPANFAHSRDHQVLQGFIETDWYRGFLPVIVRLTTPGAEVRFYRHLPMAQLQLIPLSAMEQTSAAATDSGIAGWPDDVWAEFVAVRAPRHSDTRRMGTYRTASRRAAQNGRCPYPVAAHQA